jgi:hypothetical protein
MLTIKLKSNSCRTITLQFETCGQSVFAKHPHRVEGEFCEVFSSQFHQLVKEIVRHGNDMALAGCGLIDIQSDGE